MLVDLDSPAFSLALERAGEEHGLADYYRACVRPLFRMPMTQWPLCCAGNCEPCAQVLVAVAHRVCELLNIDSHQLP